MPRTFLTAEWRKLIMAQYVVDPGVLAPYLPAGTTLDLYQDRAYVSLVGFLFDRVRVRGFPIPGHTRFEEINLRFYVCRVEPEGPRRGQIKRGVVFIREFVPRAAITFVARTIYEEPYATLPTSHAIRRVGNSLDVSYRWLHGRRWNSLSVEASPHPQPILPDTEEDFITQHYWGYTKRKKGTTSEYEVRHSTWDYYPIVRHRIKVDFGALYGTAFASLDRDQPASVLLAEGSTVSVAPGHRLPKPSKP